MSGARAAGENVTAGIELAGKYGSQLPLPGRGATATRWRVLAAVAAQDLTAARILEAHSDALAILAEAGDRDSDGTWGVFAAEAPGVRLEATGAGGEIRLDGTKPWCSLGARLDRALVSAHVGSEGALYAVDLRHPSVRAEEPEVWVSRGLRNIPSGPVHFAHTPARPIGAPGWYLTRPGFAWGGMGVAACWYGGATGLAATLRHTVARKGGELMALHVGVVDTAVHACAATLLDAAARVDRGHAVGTAGELLALRVRAVVADALERTLREVGHALGPAPLAFDEQHARRVADLQIYVRQHHGERDLAALGAMLLGGES